MEPVSVFISWSGDRSLKVAEALRDWLPYIVRGAEPWLSSEDLRKGLQWVPKTNEALGQTDVGLLVLTRENLAAPWVLFEAGAISRAMSSQHCCPILCDLEAEDLTGPLAQFQATSVTCEDDMWRLVKTINLVAKESPIDEARLRKWFDKDWRPFCETVETALKAAPDSRTEVQRKPDVREMVAEILHTVRGLARGQISMKHVASVEDTLKVAEELKALVRRQGDIMARTHPTGAPPKLEVLDPPSRGPSGEYI